MTTPQQPPIGVRLATDVEHRPGRDRPYRARVRWTDPTSKRRLSKSTTVATPEEAQAWLDGMASAAQGGVDPLAATKRLAEYGESVMTLALRGLERKTLDPYLAGWRKRVVPTLGHIPVRMITNGAVDRAVHAWIADEYSRSTVKNSLAVLVRVMEQAVRDGIIQRNPAQVTGWQREYQRAADELDDPRSLALPDWETLTTLAAALVDRSANHFTGWADVVIFAACTAARIGEVSGVRAEDIDRETWMWTVRRQTTPGPGGLIDKGTKGKRARTVPLIEEVRPIVAHRLDAATKPDSRLFTGPRGGRISTAVLRDATHWDEVVTTLGYEHLRRHDLRHTGLTWMADAGVPVHVLRKIAGHGSLTTTQRYLHPDRQSITDAGTALSAHLKARRSPGGPQLRAV
ncbi:MULTISPECIES: site-specific integrase [unclassified Micromonospora]|uniref:tyrosine-type recombinase/integrase n=1 Tax=unclassified Micromonospora TaxID=2617518 RepID=UPI0005BB1734|nr:MULTISPECIES: site-specific integrase [unclassified Micromonospora]MCK1810209.1 site-specific integrase [Micromonospora sp. R42106]MCK1835534.1 site-specific integrase [Micromonospora sp. R42003]MCK1847465.1 site-specific integrase [Micromonospora sp. R42004]MCM1015306.1 site-specific integrase [Micromonospora sp. XM-20-01]